MEIKFRRHIIILLFCLIAVKAFPQEKAAGAYNNYRETVWLNIDRYLYLPGEIIHFKAKVLEQDTYQRSALSRNIRMELLDSKGLPVAQQNLLLTDAGVEGTMLLPRDAQTGWYYLRGYTAWMRNNSSDEFGMVAIKLVNPESMDSKYFDFKARKITVKIYPHASDAGLFAGFDESLGLAVEGSILNSRGDTAASFASDKTGWTSLSFRFSSDEKYTVSLNGFSKEQYDNQVDIIRTKEIDINLKDENDFVIANISGASLASKEPYRLLIHQSYTLLWDSGSDKQNGDQFRIPKRALPNGIVQFSLIGGNNQVIATRLFSAFRSKKIEIDLPGSGILNTRSQYSFSFKAAPGNNELSVLIGQAHTDEPFYDFMPGLPGWNCTTQIPAGKTAFDGWLMGHSYPDELVYSIMDENNTDLPATQPDFLPETRSGIISGRVINKQSGMGVENVGICITVLNNNYFDAGKTDARGFYYFALPDLSGTTDYILNFTSDIDTSLQIVVNTDFASPLRRTIPNFTLSKDDMEFLRNRSTILQLQKIYDVLPAYEEPVADSVKKRVSFFLPADKTIVLDNFIKLANIREVIYEVVPNVSVRQKDNRDYLKVINSSPFSFEEETLVLLDGIPLANQKELLDLSPDRIEKIEVKNQLYVHGRSIYSAIVNFVSPNRDYAGIDLPDNSILSSLKLPVREPEKSMDEEIAAINIPVLESTLLWKALNSDVQSVSFSTNDESGNFQIMIFGFDQNGNWLFGTKKITIKN